MMSIRRTLWSAGLVAALALGGGAALVVAQEDTGATDVKPEELIESAKKAIGEKKYGKALQDLNLLTSTVGKLRVEELKKVLPDVAGWTGEEATGENVGGFMMGAGVQVKRRYTKGEASMEVELAADSPLVGMMAPLLANPAMLQGQEGMSAVTVKGKRGLLEFHKGATSGKLSFLLNANTSLLTLQGSGVQKADLTDTFGKALDLDRIEKALQN